MFGMSPSDSFLTLYVVSVGGFLLWRALARDSKVKALKAEIAALSGEVQKLSSRPGSSSTVKTPVVVIPREDASHVILSLDNTMAEFVPAFHDGPPYEEAPAPRMSGMIPVVIVNDEDDEVPETLRSRVDPLVGVDQAAE